VRTVSRKAAAWACDVTMVAVGADSPAVWAALLVVRPHGISVAPTPVGTFPVYEKLPYQVMQGSYGWPQSLGCVELPYSAAEEAYPILPYGTLVTVTP